MTGLFIGLLSLPAPLKDCSPPVSPLLIASEILFVNHLNLAGLATLGKLCDSDTSAIEIKTLLLKLSCSESFVEFRSKPSLIYSCLLID